MKESTKSPQYRKKKRNMGVLTALKVAKEQRKYLTFDLESKHNDTQDAGFTRPFLVCLHDGKKSWTHRNDASVSQMPNWAERASAPGGCVDKFLRHLFGEVPGTSRISDKFKDHDVYAHNMGGFDGLFLLSWLAANWRTYSFDILPAQGRIMMIRVWRCNMNRPRTNRDEVIEADEKDRKASGVWRFLDSYRIMPLSLAEIAVSFDVGQKLEHDLDMHEDDPRWEEYNRVDCEVLWQGIERFTKTIKNMGGEVGMTAPATAMKLFRMAYLKDRVIYRNQHLPDCEEDTNDEKQKFITKEEIDGDLKSERNKKINKPEKKKICQGCAHEFFKSAYFGGRTEVYQRQGSGWYYDVNSSYPYSMKNFMPTGKMTVLGENEDFTYYTKHNHVGFIRCTVEIPDDVYLPPLPMELDKKLKFPVGRFSGTWDWVELMVLQKIGGKILHVEKSVWIEGERILHNFIDHLYSMRDKTNPLYDLGRDKIAKIMMNSTFGKFGMEQERVGMMIIKPNEILPYQPRLPGESKVSWEKRKGLYKDATGRNSDGKRMWKPYSPDCSREAMPLSLICGTQIFMTDQRIDAAYIIPQISAHITALSRMLLWHYSSQILERGYKIFYSDTDSIITDCNEIKDSTKLGGLKKEFNGEKVSVTCYLPKMYYMTKDTVFKGEHERYPSTHELAGDKRCTETCYGCLKDDNGKITAGKHTEKNGKRLCLKKCPGCAKWKIMMKGFPKHLRTPETIERLLRKETVQYQNQEKLGILAKRQFRDTPQMITVKKSLKSEYDKRQFQLDGNTVPIKLDGPQYLSNAFLKTTKQRKKYEAPDWLATVFPEHIQTQ